MRLKTAIFLLLACMTRLWAQEFTYVDWNILRPDTLPVQYTEVIPLDEDYRSFRYEVRLDYPEYVRLTATEAERVAVWGKDLPENPDVYCQVAVSRKKGVLDVAFVPIVRRGGKYYKLASFKMNIVRSPKTLTRALSVAAGKTAAERYASNSVLSQGRWVKIGITEDGVYRLTAADLRRMGFNDPSRVKLYGYGGHVQDEVIDADTDFDDLEEVPLYRDERGLLFFGKGLISWSATDRRGRATHRVNTFAKQACYFLTEGDSPRTIEKAAVSGSPQKNLDYTPANVLYKKEEYAWYQSGRNFYESANYASSNSRTYQLPVVDPVASAGGSLKVSFTAHTTKDEGDSYVTPTVDGVKLSAMRISWSGEYDAAKEGTQTYTLNTLHEGTTGTQVTLVSTAGVDGRLGYLELCYRRQLKMRDAFLYIRHTETVPSNFVIDANGRSGLKLWCLGRRGNPMTEYQGTWSGSTYTVPVSDPTVEYVAVDVNADFPSPSYIGEVANQNLHATPATDMVIIIPASGKLYAQAERLAEAQKANEELKASYAALQGSLDKSIQQNSQGNVNISKLVDEINASNKFIKQLVEAKDKSDSLNMVLTNNLTRSLSREEMKDVDIQVLKGVVYISLADNMLYKSGSYEISERAGETLSKIAKIIMDYKEYEVLIEGNTDTDPISRPNIRNNWDLSTLRASSVVQALQNTYGVDPKRLTAAGRGEYNPVASNDTPEGKMRNRRTQIIITPKLDQFMELIDQAPEATEPVAE